ncbi:MAG: alpha/beta fold hydrolase [Parasphingopyxis sp.]
MRGFASLLLAIAGLTLSACAQTAPGPTASAPAQSHTRYIELDGARIRVREDGPADAPVLVLLHGFTMSLESWDGWVDRLAGDYRIIRFDLLGHGLTGPDPLKRYAPEERVETLGRLLDALDIERATLGGNSFGGLVAWRYAARHPERVDRLILVDSGAYSIYGVADEPVPVAPAIQAHLRNPTDAGFAASMGTIFADRSRISEARFAQIRAMMEGNGDAFVDHLAEFTLPDPTPDLARIAAPTLILWGEEDRLIPLEQASRLASAIPNARLVTYPGVGHAPQEEISARSAADVRRFLEDPDR